MNYRASRIGVAGAFLAALSGCAPGTLAPFRGTLAAGEELVAVESRPGVTTRVLVTRQPPIAGVAERLPKGVVLFFPGGEGWLVLPDGSLYGAFRRDLAALDYVAAIVDVPSSHPDGLGGTGEAKEVFRLGAEHVRDVRAVLDYVHARWPVPVYLMGHSMGAISVAHLAGELRDSRVAGIALLGSPSQRGYMGLAISVPSASLHRVSVPVVVVHHRDDGCAGSTFPTAASYPARFTRSPRTGFIEVTGGRSESADPCRGANFHSFFGVRRAVVQAVMRWFEGEEVSRVGD